MTNPRVFILYGVGKGNIDSANHNNPLKPVAGLWHHELLNAVMSQFKSVFERFSYRKYNCMAASCPLTLAMRVGLALKRPLSFHCLLAVVALQAWTHSPWAVASCRVLEMLGSPLKGSRLIFCLWCHPQVYMNSNQDVVVTSHRTSAAFISKLQPQTHVSFL